MFSVLSDSDVALVEDVIPEVTETVTVRAVPRKVERERIFAGTESHDWDTDQLLGYVVSEIERIHGSFPRDLRKETGIMRSFLGRWGEQAASIARYAFEVSDGMWRNAPIGITRFSQACDPYFAEIIAKKIS